MQRLFTEEQQESDLEKRERAVLLRELKADAKDLLISRGLPAALSDLLNYENKEEMEKSMTEVGAAFSEAVERGIKARLRGETPRRGYGFAASGEQALHDAFKP